MSRLSVIAHSPTTSTSRKSNSRSFEYLVMKQSARCNEYFELPGLSLNNSTTREGYRSQPPRPRTVLQHDRPFAVSRKGSRPRPGGIHRELGYGISMAYFIERL